MTESWAPGDARLPLGDRMKQYEAAAEHRLDPGATIVLRLDGHGFSKFTANFARPFDQRIHDAMVGTCSDLLSHFAGATLAYTQSDEITLVFPHGTGVFNERVQKIVSLAASYTSVRFNAHLSAAVAASPRPPVKNPDKTMGSAYFDGRLFAVPSVEEALNCVIWRCRGDAIRNSVSSFARTAFSTKQLEGKTTTDKLRMMEEEKGIVFKDAVPPWAIEGTIIKREQHEVEGYNGKTGQRETSLRTRAKAADRGVTVFNEENLKLVTDKYWGLN